MGTGGALVVDMNFSSNFWREVTICLWWAIPAMAEARANLPRQALSAPMASIEEIAAAQYPIFPISLLLKDKFRSLDHIANVRMPLLVVHGTKDEAIPIASGKALFELANNPKQFEAIPGGGHNNLFSFGILDVMDEFLEQQAYVQPDNPDTASKQTP